ncbi:DoxX family protein [Chryseobacterium lathyri]|uniref:Membrane protein YphA (DoxX/SURF4 family) n=1 Tax=Chryseobacterium lathyri TaxID=395933 RepID=A0ABT9SKM7_9FLAO|nr:DoxX family protein [Chryseobacterium lathyri]MDP9958995.1 putative membrane protein YphA (DoxX/SURF4 family) [Chryseobacterium lathyri]MDQ0067044.1 putative membrane protein YphA (DoxX/SURF4 family) [Chryseobacterium lathyri]
MKIVKFILCFLFALVFINAGLDKFFHYSPMPKLTAEQEKIFAAFVEIGWLMPLVGIVEVIGGVLFIFPKTRALGAIIILPVMVGIVLHNVYRDPNQMGIIMSVVMFLINIWALIDNREKYKALIS